jgi:hypothetical protein
MAPIFGQSWNSENFFRPDPLIRADVLQEQQNNFMFVDVKFIYLVVCGLVNWTMLFQVRGYIWSYNWTTNWMWNGLFICTIKHVPGETEALSLKMCNCEQNFYKWQQKILRWHSTAERWTSMEHLVEQYWKKKNEYSEKNPSQCQFVHHKSHTDCSGIKCGHLQWQASD